MDDGEKEEMDKREWCEGEERIQEKERRRRRRREEEGTERKRWKRTKRNNKKRNLTKNKSVEEQRGIKRDKAR